MRPLSIREPPMGVTGGLPPALGLFTHVEVPFVYLMVL